VLALKGAPRSQPTRVAIAVRECLVLPPDSGPLRGTAGAVYGILTQQPVRALFTLALHTDETAFS
jgi:hypothetical protein